MNTRNQKFKKQSNLLNKLLIGSIILMVLSVGAFIYVYSEDDIGTNTVEHINMRKVDKVEHLGAVHLVNQDAKKACFNKELPGDMTGKAGKKCVYKSYFKNSEFKEGKDFNLVKIKGTNANGQYYEGYIFARVTQ